MNRNNKRKMLGRYYENSKKPTYFRTKYNNLNKHFLWKRPYEERQDNIDSIDTGLDGVFKFSPIFRNALAEAYVELTGDRLKDYMLAEEITGVKHIPGNTVWHHTWKMVDGKCLMQLVPLVSHQKTCPHAGGCKRWKMEHPMADKRMMISADRMQQRMAGIITTRGMTTGHYLKRSRNVNLKIIGNDPLGNTYYRNKNDRTVYLYDHEEDKYIKMPYRRRGRMF